ncbi:MAG: UMP kinase [Candidatus Nanoarchaeia archaeon]|nr:UMP kinase [Candidatus Nanoarchaeia archaeon]
MKSEIIVLSVGGSLIVPNEIDVDFIKSFKELLIKRPERFILVVGGGGTARKYQKALSVFDNISKDDGDWVGIAATKLNSEFIKSVFKKNCHPDVISNPLSELNFTEKFLIASGWKPGFSTDFDAVILAHNLGAIKVINLSNIKYAYDKDPNKFKDAKKIEKINWKDFRKIVGNKWNPGLNTPFDPIASKKAQELGLEVVILNGKDLTNLNDYFDGKKFIGTIIKD